MLDARAHEVLGSAGRTVAAARAGERHAPELHLREPAPGAPVPTLGRASRFHPPLGAGLSRNAPDQLLDQAIHPTAIPIPIPIPTPHRFRDTTHSPPPINPNPTACTQPGDSARKIAASVAVATGWNVV